MIAKYGLSCFAAALLLGADPASAADYVLALSWEPAFCATVGQERPKPECQTATAQDYAATHLVLHGLWPQPESNSYCGVSKADITHDRNGQWEQLPPVVYAEAQTQSSMQTYLPGVRSYLDRHEWTKHGTCSGQTPDAYFGLGMSLLQQMDGSATAGLIAASAGGTTTGVALCRALRQDLGPDVARAAQIKVDTRSKGAALLTEIWFYLSDKPDGKVALTANHLTVGAATLRCDPRPLQVVAEPE
jgi:ribonuclease T2